MRYIPRSNSCPDSLRARKQNNAVAPKNRFLHTFRTESSAALQDLLSGMKNVPFVPRFSQSPASLPLRRLKHSRIFPFNRPDVGSA
jgi:hypothetical protein